MTTVRERGAIAGFSRLLLWLPILLLPPLFLLTLRAAHGVLPTGGVPVSAAKVEVLAVPLVAAATGAGSREVTLPHGWRSGPERTARHVLYRSTAHFGEAPQGLWGVFVPRRSMSASIYVNGELVATDGAHDRYPLARLWSRPLLAPIPGHLLVDGANEIAVLLSAEPAGSGMLRELYLGPYDELAPYGRWHEILRASAPLTIAVLLFTMALFMGALWSIRRQETVYKWYALALGMWGVYCINVQAVNIPIAARYWEWLRFASFGSVVLLTVLFVNRFIGIRRPRIEASIAVTGVIGVLGLFIAAAVDEQWLIRTAVPAWYAIAVAAGVYTALELVRRLWHEPNLESSLLLTAGAIMFCCGVRDWLVFAGHLQGWDGLFVNYTALPVMLVFGVILFRRFTNALREVEQLNVDLERRVADKHRELAANYDRLRELERQRLLADERARIMRDMHDGVGGHMISTVALIESGRVTLPEVAGILRAAMEDLRLMIDSLDPDVGDIATALRTLRARVEPRLRAAGTTLHWKIQDLPELAPLGPEGTLNMLRIVQEALNNALRHSGGTEVTLRVCVEPVEGAQGVVVEVADNGAGMPAKPGAGRGLQNMHRRARLLGAELAIDSGPSGTRVRLVLRGGGTANLLRPM